MIFKAEASFTFSLNAHLQTTQPRCPFFNNLDPTHPNSNPYGNLKVEVPESSGQSLSPEAQDLHFHSLKLCSFPPASQNFILILCFWSHTLKTWTSAMTRSFPTSSKSLPPSPCPCPAYSVPSPIFRGLYPRHCLHLPIHNSQSELLFLKADLTTSILTTFFVPPSHGIKPWLLSSVFEAICKETTIKSSKLNLQTMFLPLPYLTFRPI